MLLIGEREIEVNDDLDGVHFRWSVGLKNVKRIITKGVLVPEYDLEESPNGLLISPWEILQGGWMEFYDSFRPGINHREDLQRLRLEAQALNRKLSLAVLTGRKPNENAVTRHRLKREGLWDRFDDHYLKPGYISYQWKEKRTAISLREGKSVVIRDDSLWVGYAAERARQRVAAEMPEGEVGRLITYVICGLPLEWLARRRGITFPESVIVKLNYTAANDDLIEKMRKGEI